MVENVYCVAVSHEFNLVENIKPNTGDGFGTFSEFPRLVPFSEKINEYSPQ